MWLDDKRMISVQCESCWLYFSSSSPIPYRKKELGDWQTPFEGPWELMPSDRKPISHRMQMLHKVLMPCERNAVHQLTQSTHQHEKRFHFSETSSLKTLLTLLRPFSVSIVFLSSIKRLWQPFFFLRITLSQPENVVCL